MKNHIYFLQINLVLFFYQNLRKPQKWGFEMIDVDHNSSCNLLHNRYGNIQDHLYKNTFLK